ncbi:MAG TPA: hypothetical protein VHZ33_11705 [Trebonia sp.]|jgi:photosystem II stability/assembly factor-like uncharacterized protein|nr:hypothetical protein [Trebonia sp.]
MNISFGRVTALAVAPVLLLAAAVAVVTAGNAGASGPPPPPKGFEADSASFVSAQAGYVLGSRGCSLLPCKALLEKTANGGTSWAKVTAPNVRLVPPFTASPASAVSTVRFANKNDGWLFNPGLWQTTNGGKSWHRVALSGVAGALAVSGGEAYVSTQPANGSSLQAKLYKSAVGSGRWTLVRGVGPQNQLTAFGHSAWAGVAPDLWTTTNGGKTWAKLTFNCPAGVLSPSPVAASSPSDIAIACSDQGFPQPGMSIKEVFTSTNGGRTFREQGKPSEAGEVYLLAMVPGHQKELTLVAASGATFLDRSVNGGKTWTQATFTDGGTGMRDLAYVSATTGYQVHVSDSPALAYGQGLLKTTNAGKTWRTVKIP